MIVVTGRCDAEYGGSTCGVPIAIQESRDAFTLSVLSGLTTVAQVRDS